MAYLLLAAFLVLAFSMLYILVILGFNTGWGYRRCPYCQRLSKLAEGVIEYHSTPPSEAQS